MDFRSNMDFFQLDLAVCALHKQSFQMTGPDADSIWLPSEAPVSGQLRHFSFLQ